jgi:hypothetical protein
MSDVAKTYIAKVAERSALTREKFTESNVPSALNSIVVVPFFGDLRHEFIFSSLILNKWKELNPNSYLVVCSWPGHYGLYNYADEFWSLSDPSILKNLVRSSNVFANPAASYIEKILLRYLDNSQLMLPDDRQLTRFYDGGITDAYVREHGDVLFNLPAIPAANIAFSRMVSDGQKRSVFVMPTLYIETWKRKGMTPILTSEAFWLKLIERLSERYVVVVGQNYFTHDLQDSTSDPSIVFINDWNIMVTLAAMRSCDCVLSVFNQSSKYAYLARTPVLIMDERQRYFNLKDYELDDLCAKPVPKRYIYSFAPIVDGDTEFIIDAAVNRLNEFIPACDRSKLPPTAEMSFNVPYAQVRKKALQSIEMDFFLPAKIDEDC